MVALGRTLIGVFLVFLLLASLLIGGSFGGFLGGGYMIVAAILVIGFWLTYAAFTIRGVFLANDLAKGRGDKDKTLTLANRLFVIGIILSAVTGLALGFLAFVGCGPLWLPSLYHWAGMVGVILAFLAFFLLPVIVRACIGGKEGWAAFHRWWWAVFMPLMVASIWATLWIVLYILLSGSINESEYLAATRIYKLPFPGGESSWVIQGNNSRLNHNNDHNGQKYSWDFRRRCGTPVLAARAGTIKKVSDGFDGVGGDNNNEIQVTQYKNDVIKVGNEDGTTAFYLHIQKDSAKELKLAKGSTVSQGQQIAKVGTSAKITFNDGIPSMPPSEGNYALLKQLDGVSQDLGYGKIEALGPGERGAGDVAFVTHLIPGLDGLGATGGGAHARGEYADLDTLPRQIKRAAVLIYRLTR